MLWRGVGMLVAIDGYLRRLGLGRERTTLDRMNRIDGMSRASRMIVAS
jgi:hypothetical protein